MSDNTLILPSRRAFLGASGKTLSATAVALVLGSNLKAASAADASQDIQILNAAIALEHEGIAAYQIAATSGLLQPAVVEIGVTFQGHHKGHRDIWSMPLKRLAGSQRKKNPWLSMRET